MERSFVMIKPDGIQRELVGEVINRFERKGVKLVGLKLTMISKELAEEHYEMHKERPFFGELVEFVTSGPVLAMVMEGENIIKIIRKIVGATKAEDAVPGTIRGDFVLDTGHNIIHASDSIESANREISLFFEESELIEYSLTLRPWIYSE